jgi:hypothetical protein
MSAQAVRLDDGVAVVTLSGHRADETLLACQTGCDAEYRVFYTPNEERNLDEYRFQAQERMQSEHPRHSPSIVLSERPGIGW